MLVHLAVDILTQSGIIMYIIFSCMLISERVLHIRVCDEVYTKPNIFKFKYFY
jgi:hypothetical protein